MSAEPLDQNLFNEKTKNNIHDWLRGPYDDTTKQEIQKLLKTNPGSLKDAFFQKLAFGTAGIRAIMGIGTNRLNIYTIRIATQGLANYVLKQNADSPTVVIGYDSRNNSRHFAEEAACVLSANKIQVWLFDHLSPTPLVSFACREKRAIAAIMITASHNPAEYNGYKVFWEDGAQILPPHDKGIIEEVNAITDISKIQTSDLSSSNIHMLGQDIYDRFVDKVYSLQTLPEQNKAHGNELHILYSNLHGTGITVIPHALNEWGFFQVSLVEEQKTLDGNFPNASFPNPEEKEALKFGVQHLTAKKADIFIASDPDADRVGVVALHKSKPYYLTGNQVACLCLHHLIGSMKKGNRLPSKPACIKTIVTTELFAKIAKQSGITCFDVLTGFKYIGEKIREWEATSDSYQYLFGAEESYGYLLGTHSRDKDATGVSCLIAEMALDLKLQKKTLADFLFEIYETYGIYREELGAVALSDSSEGMEKKEAIMKSLRSGPPQKILDIPVKRAEDYLKQTSLDMQTNQTTKLQLPQSDVLRFWLEDETKLVIRPSGTEPKIKIYAGVFSDTKDIASGIQDCDARLSQLIDTIKKDMHA